MRMALDTIGQVLRILWAHKLRSFLTMFGIAWGVGSLLFLVGVGEGFRSGQRKNMANIGEDVIFIWGGQIPAVEGQAQENARAISSRTRITWTSRMKPRWWACGAGGGPRRHPGRERLCHGQRIGDGQHAELQPDTLPAAGRGRWLNQADEDQKRQVCVLGFQMMRNLFPGRPAIGSTILLNGIRFEVVGVLVEYRAAGK